ncbi:hypothetical protein Pelo_4061 [Pelomyxa schiedti]|nr:hypothetical protein Pelo_4061 [Pelomyxa schiedti]
MGKRCAAGKRLEDFHYGWEAMVGLLRAGTEIRLTEHYNGATFYLGSNGELAQNTLFYPANPQHKSLRRHFKNSDVSCLCNTVVKPGTRNPGSLLLSQIFATFTLFFFHTSFDVARASLGRK